MWHGRASNQTERSGYLDAVLSAIYVLFGVAALYLAVKVHVSMDENGDTNPSCFKEDLRPVSAPDVWSITGRHIYCDDVIHSSDIDLYLNELHTTPSRKYLFLSYSPDDGAPDPNITWIDKTHVKISLGHVTDISKITSEVHGVSFKYDIIGETLPRPGWWITSAPSVLGIPILGAVAMAAFFAAWRRLRSVIDLSRGSR
jgi:hypothetical protein